MEHLDLVQNVFNRMKKAHFSGKGVRINKEELAEMNLTIFGEIWDTPDPRHLTSRSSGQAKKCGVCGRYDVHAPWCSAGNGYVNPPAT